MIRRIALALLFCLVASGAHASGTCTLPYTLVNGTLADASKVMANFNALVSCIGVAGTQVATNAVLTTTPTSTGPVTRLDWSSGFGAPPQTFEPLTGNCAANSLISDGGSCQDSTDGNSWKGQLVYPLDIREWGQTYPITLTVNSSTGSPSAASWCVAASPCKTLAQFGTKSSQFNLQGQIGTVNLTGNVTESLAFNAPSTGAASPAPFNFATTPMWLINGVGGSGAVTITGDANHCYVLLANAGAAFAIKGLTIVGAGTGCQSGLYAQAGTIWSYGDIVINGASANAVTEEEQGSMIICAAQVSCGGFTIKGTYGGNGINQDSSSLFESDTPVTIASGASFDAGAGAVFNPVMGSIIKLFGSPASVVFGGSVTGFNFTANGGQIWAEGGAPASWPGTIGRVDYGGHYFGSDAGACVGGAMGCPNVTAPTGLGGGGTEAVSEAQYSGTIELTMGTTASFAGVAQVGFVPYWLFNGQCAAQLSNGSGAWQSNSTVNITGLTATGFAATWVFDPAASTRPTNTDTYFITYVCNGPH